MNKEELKNKLNNVYVNRDGLNTVIKDRLDFGFDSIYFRYSEICDELAMYKSIVNHTNPLDEKKRLSGYKEHFYITLEQLIRAHEKEEVNLDPNK